MSGIDSAPNNTLVTINLSKCDQSILEEGQECMAGEELVEYYSGLELFVNYYDTKIDFEDIDNPIKTAIKLSKIAINP